MLERWRSRVARWISPPTRGSTRAYAGARVSRLTTGFGQNGSSSADTELGASLTQLRSRSRQLMRDAPYAKRAKVIIVNNVIGAGVGLQAQVKTTRGSLNDRINGDIEDAWRQWARADSCHTGGSLHFCDFERACLSEVVTAGEVFIRKHYRRFGQSKVPFALELIEAERMCDELTFPQTMQSADVKLGVEVDTFGRPVAYWMRSKHPGEVRFMANQSLELQRVPASEMFHLRVVDRWPQTRGEPWLHAVLRKLNDMEEYSAAELLAARLSANYFATIESPDGEPLTGETQDDGSKQINIEPGVIEQLSPGDKLAYHTPNRPNPALDPFMRYMLREVAAGVGVSYESVSRDYSQSNYSSSRLALLDDRDLWRVLQQWWVRSFREPLHAEWMQQAVMSRAITAVPLEAFANFEAYTAVSWKLRGWSWVDPTKEVEAFKEAVKAGFTTVQDVIAATAGGSDFEDFLVKRRYELDALEKADIDVDTTVVEEVPVAPAAPPPTPEPKEPEDNQDDEARARIGVDEGLDACQQKLISLEGRLAALSSLVKANDAAGMEMSTGLHAAFAAQSARTAASHSALEMLIRAAVASMSTKFVDVVKDLMPKSLALDSGSSSSKKKAALTKSAAPTTGADVTAEPESQFGETASPPAQPQVAAVTDPSGIPTSLAADSESSSLSAEPAGLEATPSGSAPVIAEPSPESAPETSSTAEPEVAGAFPEARVV